MSYKGNKILKQNHKYNRNLTATYINQKKNQRRPKFKNLLNYLIPVFFSLLITSCAQTSPPNISPNPDNRKAELGKEEIDQQKNKAANARFEENISIALDWIKNNPERGKSLFLADDLAAIQKAMSARTLDQYFQSEEKKLAVLADKGTVLQPTIFLVADFGHMIRSSKNEEGVRARLLNTTLTLYGPEAQKILQSRLKNVRQIDAKFVSTVYQWWTTIDLDPIDPGPVDDTSLMNCSTEVGYSSSETDGATACLPPGAAAPSGGNWSYFSANGLIAQRDIPLEPQLTCTKDQSRRGTCVGFAITASLETRASRARNTKFNFSEQYNYFKSEIYTGNSRYSYGLPTQSTVDDWGDDDWQTGRETAWTYNRGLSMDPIDTGSSSTFQDNIYPDSCDGYTGYCTDYAFQGTPNASHTVFTRPSPQSSQDNFGAKTAYQYTWGWWIFGPSRESVLNDEIVPLLNNNIPVIVSYTVTDNYMGLGTNGYLVWSSSDSQRSGGHATLIVGFVSKDNLPSGAPTPVGSGYFIIKNSWGANRADCGYEYVDEKWLREQMRGLSSLSVQ